MGVRSGSPAGRSRWIDLPVLDVLGGRPGLDQPPQRPPEAEGLAGDEVESGPAVGVRDDP